jgi:DNA mismatch endonuclease, patch repair protein
VVDIFTRQKRSQVMSRIRGRDTKPELAVRSVLHRWGYRFRLFQKDLPGRPDVVLPRYRAVVFVHGCFWHRHPGCQFAYTPKSRRQFWRKKFTGNVTRDAVAQTQLAKLGWKVITVWECETNSVEQLEKVLRRRGLARPSAVLTRPPPKPPGAGRRSVSKGPLPVK